MEFNPSYSLKLRGESMGLIFFFTYGWILDFFTNNLSVCGGLDERFVYPRKCSPTASLGEMKACIQEQS